MNYGAYLPRKASKNGLVSTIHPQISSHTKSTPLNDQNSLFLKINNYLFVQLQLSW
jgi:hypothetical protein